MIISKLRLYFINKIFLSIPNKMFLKKIDLLSPPISLFYKRLPSHSSFISGILTKDLFRYSNYIFVLADSKFIPKGK